MGLTRSFSSKILSTLSKFKTKPSGKSTHSLVTSKTHTHPSLSLFLLLSIIRLPILQKCLSLSYRNPSNYLPNPWSDFFVVNHKSFSMFTYKFCLFVFVFYWLQSNIYHIKLEKSIHGIDWPIYSKSLKLVALSVAFKDYISFISIVILCSVALFSLQLFYSISLHFGGRF